MNKLTRSCRIWLWVALTMTMCGAVPAKATPKIAVENALYDFGSITNGMKLEHDFIIRNDGDADLQISSVVSSCDVCLQAVCEQTLLRPGSQTRLRCRLDLRELNGPSLRTAALNSNDPRNPQVVVSLTGNVVPLFRLTPPQVYLDMTRAQRETSVEVLSLKKMRAPLTEVICQDSNIAAQLVQKNAEEYELTLSALKSLPYGYHSNLVTLRSLDSNDPPCLIEFGVRHPDGLEILPSQLIFHRQEEPQHRILWIKQHGAETLDLLDVIPPSAKYHSEIVPDLNGRDYQVYITAWGQDADIKVTTNAFIVKLRDRFEKEQSVKVPVYTYTTREKIDHHQN